MKVSPNLAISTDKPYRRLLFWADKDDEQLGSFFCRKRHVFRITFKGLLPTFMLVVVNRCFYRRAVYK